MKIRPLIFLLISTIILLIIRAFFNIPVDFKEETIGGINLIIDVTCGSFIVSILTYLLTVTYPLYKNRKTAKDLVKYKLAQLDLMKCTPSDVHGNKKDSFEIFMREFDYDLYYKFIPLDVLNSHGMGIISNWVSEIHREFNEISTYINYLDIDFLKTLEDIKNRDVFWQINTVNLLYNTANTQKYLVKEHSVSLIKDLDSLNNEVKSLITHL